MFKKWFSTTVHSPTKMRMTINTIACEKEGKDSDIISSLEND